MPFDFPADCRTAAERAAWCLAVKRELIAAHNATADRVEFATVDRLREMGWWSGRSDGDWRARCVPPGSAPAEERRILAGLVNAARFGDVPPTNGGAA